MTAFLTIIIVIFVAIAIWQMVKIFDLAQVGVSNTQIATDNDNKVNAYLMLAFLAFIYILTFICFIYWGDLPLLSNAASEHGAQVDNLKIITLVILFIVQLSPSIYCIILRTNTEEKKEKRPYSMRIIIL